MKKQTIAAVLAAALTFSASPFAFAENDKVEISFKVGDSVLSINGVDTEVETPYVAGEGTTLVPLRVITEAFGAQVDWEGETKTITLTYPNVNIVLQIDNIIAKVNDHSETLLEAPALSANGVTMVPLRFISETFGADVGYNSDTQAILVTKEIIDDSATVVGITDMVKTGDSYYEWSIETPQQMKMTDRRLDGLSTTFTADDGSEMYIDVYRIDDDTVSFDEQFSKVKDSFSSYTLMEAEKLTDESGHQYMHFQAKDKESFIDYREYYADKYTYCIISNIEISEDNSVKNMILAVADTFQLGGIDNQTYDLSTVHNFGERKYRTISDDTYKVSFRVPADYYMSTVSDSENEFRFLDPSDNSNAYVALGIYSKTSDVTAFSLAQKDHDLRVDNSNPEFVTVTDVSSTGSNSCKYTQKISGSTQYDSYIVDTFFENGDYVYNFTVALDSADDEMIMNDILQSITTEELDSSKIGKLLRNDSDDTNISVKIDDYKFDIPASWKTISGSGSNFSGIMCLHESTMSSISLSIMEDSEFKNGNLSSVINDIKKSVTSDKDNLIEKDIEYTSINGQRFAYFSYQKKSKDYISYSTVYLSCKEGKAFLFSLSQNEITYNSKEIETFKSAIESFTEQ